MLLSIVIPTVNREQALIRLVQNLGHIAAHCELIVVDQNTDDHISKVFKNYQFKHIKSAKKGSSNARNLGLFSAQGKWCYIMDDDSWCDQNTLPALLKFLEHHDPQKGVIINPRNPNDQKLIPLKLNRGWSLSFSNLKDSLIIPSISLVYPTEALKKSGGFSLTLGIGAPFGAAEEADMMLRLVKNGVTFEYLEESKIFHADVDYRAMGPKKSYLYAKGFGALCNFHNFHGLALFKIFKSFAASFLYFFKDRNLSQSYWSSGTGRLTGYLEAFQFRKEYFSKINF